MRMKPLMTENNVRHGAATCRWAVSTISLPPPAWYEAEVSPWACRRDPTARPLVTTERCVDCPRWEARGN